MIFCGFASTQAQSQTVVQINAGSRAPWGQNQNLLIDAKGRCTYYIKEVNGRIKDSSVFNISTKQLDSLFTKAMQVGFYSLNKKYDGGYSDGAGIFIAIRHLNQKNSVSLLNTDIPQVSELVALLNRFLLPRKIRIYYGQSSPK